MSKYIVPDINMSYPIPPAPDAAPTATAFVKLISNLTKVHERMEVIVDGKTAWNIICHQDAPVALRASIVPVSISSMLSEYAFIK